MIRGTSSAQKLLSPLPYLVAGAAALLFAWLVSGTRFVTTGVQFVAPLGIVMAVHLAWLAGRRQLVPGFAVTLLARSLATAAGIVVLTALLAILAPMPASAELDASSLSAIAGTVVAVIACLAVLALVVGAGAALIYGAGLGVRSLYRWFRSRSGPPQGPGQSRGPTRLLDAGIVAMALAAVAISSLEGTSPRLTLGAQDQAASTVDVAAPPARVWQEVGKATSPRFPLPVMLQSIPQPVAVLVDEGAELGARRIVRFRGREGEGDLTLRVVLRTPTEVVFEAVSDTSPVAMWVRHKSLTFRVEAAGTGTRLTVTSDYDRLLAPAWFFRPYIRIAAYLAADVLARDTKARAEAR